MQAIAIISGLAGNGACFIEHIDPASIEKDVNGTRKAVWLHGELDGRVAVKLTSMCGTKALLLSACAVVTLAVAADSPAFMMVSGIYAAEEMCLTTGVACPALQHVVTVALRTIVQRIIICDLGMACAGECNPQQPCSFRSFSPARNML